MSTKARVAGVGMIPFTKPGQSEDWDVMAEKAIRLALTDAGVTYEQVQQAYVGYVYADSTAGQSALYRVGCTGIPIVNVNNNCSTGSTALYLARQMVESGHRRVRARGRASSRCCPARSAWCSTIASARSIMALVQARIEIAGLKDDHVAVRRAAIRWRRPRLIKQALRHQRRSVRHGLA